MKRFLLSIIIFLSLIIFPLPVLAGSCGCTQYSPATGNRDSCNFTTNINSSVDCDAKNGTTLTVLGTTFTYSNCKYYIGDSCTCIKSGMFSQNKSCSTNDECLVGAGVTSCCNGKCYYDQEALAIYNNNQTNASSFQDEIRIIKPILSVTIPNVIFSNPANTLDSEGKITVPFLAEYLAGIYQFAVIAGSMVAVVVIILNGFRMTISAGGPEKNKATQNIVKAITGLFILWSSYALFNTLNPNLTQLNELKVKYITPVPDIDVIEEPLTGGVEGAGYNGIVSYKQFDSRWGGEVYGYIDQLCDPVADKEETTKNSTVCCTSIRAAGCGPTSLAMVLATLGANATPLETAEFMGEEGNGRICNRGTDLNTTVSKLSSSPWPGFASIYIQKENVIKYVSERKPIIMLCRNCSGYRDDGTIRSYGGHYIVLTGYDESRKRIWVNDPAGTATTGITTMTESQLDNNAGFWYIYKK